MERLLQQAPDMRAMEGNLAFHPYLDAKSAARLTLLHEWRDQNDFDSYTASSAFARLGAALRPIMTRPSSSRRFDAELIEAVR